MPISTPSLKGKVAYEVETVLNQLVSTVNQLEAENRALTAKLADVAARPVTMPAPAAQVPAGGINAAIDTTALAAKTMHFTAGLLVGFS